MYSNNTNIHKHIQTHTDILKMSAIWKNKKVMLMFKLQENGIKLSLCFLFEFALVLVLMLLGLWLCEWANKS